MTSNGSELLIGYKILTIGNVIDEVFVSKFTISINPIEFCRKLVQAARNFNQIIDANFRRGIAPLQWNSLYRPLSQMASVLLLAPENANKGRVLGH